MSICYLGVIRSLPNIAFISPFASHLSCSILAGFEVSKNTHFKVTVITELDDGKIYRKPIFDGKNHGFL